MSLSMDGTFLNLELGQTILVNQTIVNGDGSLNRKYSITQSDLVGSLYVKQHDLNLDSYDVTILDSQGDIDLPWKPLGNNHIQIDFGNLAPITQTYTLLIQV